MDNWNKSPEKFTKEEAYFIEPFFTNLDRNVFAAKYLPSEVLGALASRYSRSTKGVRRLFFDEYIKPILEPNLDNAAKSEIRQAEVMRRELSTFVDYLHAHGGWERVVNSRRARSFFEKWLAAYGDDSIAQMAGAHLFFENISNVATKVLEDFRIGFAPLEKSTRYVLFDQKVGGRYPYYLEPDILRSKFGQEYVRICNLLFRRYVQSIEPLSKYLSRHFPQEPDQSDRAYLETIKAKTCDVLRYFLPAATLTNVGFFGVGQAFEYVITKCLAHPLVEIRQLAKAAQFELKKVIPSLVGRATSPRGKIYQRFVAGTEKDLEKMASVILNPSIVTLSPSLFCHSERSEESRLSLRTGSAKSLRVNSAKNLDSSPAKPVQNDKTHVELVEWESDAEDKIVASLLYKYSNLPYSHIKEKVKNLNAKQKVAIIKKAVSRRKVRQHRLIRAFENTYYKFDIVANLGAYRDLHRHRMLTQERQRFTTELGFDVPADLARAKLEKPYIDAAEKVVKLYRQTAKTMPDQAQYLVMMGHRIRWYQWQNLRELAWEAELRTGPQGHPDYRKIEQQKVQLVRRIHPALASALKFVDFSEYNLARRESEKRIDKKLGLIV